MLSVRAGASVPFPAPGPEEGVPGCAAARPPPRRRPAGLRGARPALLPRGRALLLGAAGPRRLLPHPGRAVQPGAEPALPRPRALQVGWPRWRPGWNAPIRRRSRWWLPSGSFRGFLESPVPLFFAEWYGFSLNLPLCNDFFFSFLQSANLSSALTDFFLQRNGSPQLSRLFLVYPSAPILFGVLWILFPFSGFMEIRLTKS